jgi:hypothetical protein
LLHTGAFDIADECPYREGKHGVDCPGVMLALFAVLAVTTAIGLVVYNRAVVPLTARGETE